MKWENLLLGVVLTSLAVFAFIGALKAEKSYEQNEAEYEELIQKKEDRITELEEWVEAAKIAYGGGELARYVFPIHPDDYLFPTSPFGVRVSPFDGETLHEHSGVDLLGVWQARIVAVADGFVIDHWLVPGTVANGKTYTGERLLGGCIRILHEDGTISVYGHLSWDCVREGQFVRAGEVIGRQGATGKCTGPHLHFELILADIGHVNPLLYLKTPTKDVHDITEKKNDKAI